MGWNIDYHIHTTYSDGIMSPGAIVRAADKLNMKAMAVTDHDSINGVQEALAEGRRLGMHVVTGVEFATSDESGVDLHMLGYGFDPENQPMQEMLAWMTNERDKRNVKLIKGLQDMGCDITFEELLKGRNNTFVGKPVIARLLVAKGYIDTWQEAFQDGQYLGSSEAKAIRKVKVNTTEAIRTIMGAGGVAVLAHPIQAKEKTDPDDEDYYQRMDRLIGRLTGEGLYGLECYHPDQDRRQTLRFLDLAEKYSLKVSRGTDFHGEDYNSPRATADYLEEGNHNGYGIYPRDFIDV